LKAAGRRAAELSAEGLVDPEQVLSDDDLAPVLELVRRYRGVEDTDRRAHEHVERARAAVAPFPTAPRSARSTRPPSSRGPRH